MNVVMRDRLFADWLAAAEDAAAPLLAMAETDFSRLSIDQVNRRARLTEEEFAQLASWVQTHVRRAPHWHRIDGVYRNLAWSE